MGFLDALPEVPDPGFVAGDCCSVFIVIGCPDPDTGVGPLIGFNAQILVSGEPCDTPFVVGCCSPEGVGAACDPNNPVITIGELIQLAYIECKSVADTGLCPPDQVALNWPCGSDVHADGTLCRLCIGGPASDYCRNLTCGGFSCQIVGWGYTVGCGPQFIPIKGPPATGPQPCPPGTALTADGTCRPLDPPLPLASDGNGFAHPIGPYALPVHPVVSLATIQAVCGDCTSTDASDAGDEGEL
jgi:hypothetical protein